MDDINIGNKILEYRKSKNLSIRELAQRASVTPSLLSQIERGLANPSINSLKMISKALDIPIFNFFMGTVDKEALVVKRDNRTKIMFPENKNFAYELLSPDLSGAIEFILMTLTPKSSSSEELMGHEGEEAAYIIDGKIELYLDEQLIILDKGDSVKIPPFMKHRWNNPFRQTVEVIFAVTPPSF